MPKLTCDHCHSAIQPDDTQSVTLSLTNKLVAIGERAMRSLHSPGNTYADRVYCNLRCLHEWLDEQGSKHANE